MELSTRSCFACSPEAGLLARRQTLARRVACLGLSLLACGCSRYLGSRPQDSAQPDTRDAIVEARPPADGFSERADLDQIGPVSLCEGFSGGEHLNTRLSSEGRLELTAGALSGSYTSAPCDAGHQVTWSELRLLPAAAYGKPLSASSESGYPDFRASAVDLVGLWHLDGPLGPMAADRPVADASALNHQGVTRNNDGAGLAYVAGKLGQALSCDGLDDYVEIASSWELRGLEQLTLQLWASAGYSGPASQYRRLVSFWGTADSLGDTFQLSHFSSGHLMFMTSASPSGLLVAEHPWEQLAQVWYHLAAVYDGAQLKLYIDGAEHLGDLRSGPLSDRSGPLYLCQGGSSSPPPVYVYWGQLDEVALWRRALPPAEIRALRLRGASSLRLQARLCDEPSCRGRLFVGPDGTSATFYSEAASSSPNPPVFDLTSLGPGRYLQWQVTLTRDHLELNPQLVQAQVAGQ